MKKVPSLQGGWCAHAGCISCSKICFQFSMEGGSKTVDGSLSSVVFNTSFAFFALCLMGSLRTAAGSACK